MVGIDLVYLPEFEKKLKTLDLSKVFLPHELSQNKSVESLAGIFAAKEAFFKAIGKKEDWLSVWIEKNPSAPFGHTQGKGSGQVQSGKPKLYSTLISQEQKPEVSISHAGDYAIAIVIL